MRVFAAGLRELFEKGSSVRAPVTEGLGAFEAVFPGMPKGSDLT